MSGRANVGGANDHQVTVRLGYYLIELLSYWVTVSQATNFKSDSCPSGYCLVGLLSIRGMSSEKCP